MAKNKEVSGRKYEWWEQERALAMLGRLTASLESVGPEGRLCTTEETRPDGIRKTTLWVEDATGQVVGNIEDDGWDCPPFCAVGDLPPPG